MRFFKLLKEAVYFVVSVLVLITIWPFILNEVKRNILNEQWRELGNV
jgi:hypothetical protein